MTDKGKTLTGLAMEEAALVTLLRTGGEAGRDHLFGYDRIRQRHYGAVCLAADDAHAGWA